MGYLDEAGLARYDDLIKSWVTYTAGTVQGSKSMLNWQKTSAAGAVTCYPVPAAPLEPVVNFAFTETLPEGTKSPDNPSTITGVSSVEVTRCGKNLCPSKDTTETIFGVEFTPQSDGGYKLYGTTDNTNTIRYYLTNSANLLVLKAGQTYTISLGSATENTNILFQGFNNQNQYIFSIHAGESRTVTVSNDKDEYLYCPIVVIKTTGAVDTTLYPQIELGSTATTFEPYEGTDYTVNLNGTYYGGTVDLATGVMTVTHAAVTPDASTVDISSAPAALPLDYADTYGRTITSADGTSLVVGSTGGTVVYKLATPQTVQLDPISISALSQTDKYTPRINTVYSDQTSIQVGYPKSPIYSAQELTNAIISLGGNI